MMSASGGLNPRAVAGSPSVTRFTHSSCTGFSTSGMPAHQPKIPPISQHIRMPAPQPGKPRRCCIPHTYPPTLMPATSCVSTKLHVAAASSC